MGDIFRPVQICGVRADGRKGRCRTVDALLDNGATASVIRRWIANATMGSIVPRFDEVEGKDRDVMLAKLKVSAPDCGQRGRVVIVDDDLVDRAGKNVAMILGSDYMQRTHMAILHSDRKDYEGVACRRPPKPRR